MTGSQLPVHPTRSLPSSPSTPVFATLTYALTHARTRNPPIIIVTII